MARAVAVAGALSASVAAPSTSEAKPRTAAHGHGHKALHRVSLRTSEASSSAASPASPASPEARQKGALEGIYVRGDTAGRPSFPALLDRVAVHGMNAIVLDVKDFDGLVTYPSRVALAAESGATAKAPIASFAEAIRLAHERRIKVIARISCFHDDFMAKAHPGMAVRGISGHVYRNGWLDPRNENAQAYVIELAREAMASGADEIQLDYVRYPVTNIKLMDFGLDTRREPRAKIDVITRFVARVHDLTRARGVPLSVDIFGVVALGRRDDIQNLGQDPAELARHAEVLSPMVYPSHYDEGFNGWDNPGDHPEIAGMGVKSMLEHMIDPDGRSPRKLAIVRPWLQAVNHKSETFGPDYIRREIRTSDAAGGIGWLLWNPGQNYDVSWRALPKR